MDPITLRLPTDTLTEIDEEAKQKGLSRAEYLREIVENHHVDDKILSEYKGKLANYEREVEQLQTDVERLQNEKRTILDQREEHTELVQTIERQQSLAERKAKAGLLTKTKWALFGMSDDSE